MAKRKHYPKEIPNPAWPIAMQQYQALPVAIRQEVANRMVLAVGTGCVPAIDTLQQLCALHNVTVEQVFAWYNTPNYIAIE